MPKSKFRFWVLMHQMDAVVFFVDILLWSNRVFGWRLTLDWSRALIATSKELSATAHRMLEEGTD